MWAMCCAANINFMPFIASESSERAAVGMGLGRTDGRASCARDGASCKAELETE